jgi:hypothetical protein
MQTVYRKVFCITICFHNCYILAVFFVILPSFPLNGSTAIFTMTDHSGRPYLWGIYFRILFLRLFSSTDVSTCFNPSLALFLPMPFLHHAPRILKHHFLLDFQLFLSQNLPLWKY